MLILFRRRRSADQLNHHSRRSGRALITGASSGIGRATALHLAQHGWNVIATSRNASRLQDLQNEASENGLRITAVELDINSDQAVERIVPEIITEHGAIDALVNNAGFGLWGPVEDLSISEIKNQFETNFFAAVRMMQATLPAMIEQRNGIIVNVSSVLGRMGTPFNGAYVSSKFALEGISESLRTELQPFGVRIAMVEPGLFRTDFPNNIVRGKRVDSSSNIYEPYIARYRSSHGRFERFGGDPVRVARLIHRIITSPSPHFRNPIGMDARIGMLGARLLPERIYWRLMQRATLGK